jgi:hypothetical protein
MNIRLCYFLFSWWKVIYYVCLKITKCERKWGQADFLCCCTMLHVVSEAYIYSFCSSGISGGTNAIGAGNYCVVFQFISRAQQYSSKIGKLECCLFSLPFFIYWGWNQITIQPLQMTMTDKKNHPWWSSTIYDWR